MHLKMSKLKNTLMHTRVMLIDVKCFAVDSIKMLFNYHCKTTVVLNIYFFKSAFVNFNQLNNNKY